jgi:ABC-type transport system involved in cytochrome c biogenesis permease subunit
VSISFYIDLLNLVLTASYLAGSVLYGFLFFKRFHRNNESLIRYCGYFLKTTIALHVVYFVLRIQYYGHAPITNIFELMTLLAFGVTLTYIYIELRTGVHETGFFIISVAFVLQVISGLYIKEPAAINPMLRSWLLGVHVSSAIIGYSAIIISGIYGFLYLMLYRNIKLNRVGNFYKKLPSLQLLEKLTESSIIFGFFFLTVTVIIGAIWLPMAIKDFSYADPKLVSTFIIWLLYLFGFILIKVRSQRKLIMRLALVGFVLTFISVLIVNVFVTSFHKFY